MISTFDPERTRHRIYIVRHAETLDGRQTNMDYPGSTRLTEGGRRQAEAMRDYLRDVDFDQAWSSDLDRAIETAGIILQNRELELNTSELFREVDISPARMVANARSAIEAQSLFAYWHQHIGKLMPKEVAHAIERAEAGVARLLTEPWKDLLLVAHGGFNRILMCCLLKIPYDFIPIFEQDYCGLSIIDLDVDPHTANITFSSLRLSNVTAYDLTKRSLRLTDAEIMARAMEKEIAKMFEQD